MTTARQKQFIPALYQSLNGISQLDPSNLVGRDRLGIELSFEFMLTIFVEIHNSSAKLLKLDFDKIPYGVLAQLHSPLTSILSVLQQIQNFSPSNHGNAIGARDALVQSLEDQWSAIYIIVQTLLNESGEDAAKNEMDVLLSQVKTSVQLSSEAAESLRAKQNEIDKNLDSFLKEKTLAFETEGQKKLAFVEEALDQVRSAAAEAGVSQTSKYFKDEASEHLITSRIWLGASLAIIIALVCFSLFGNAILNWAGTSVPTDADTDLKLILYMTQKGLIVFCLIFALIWAAKNYGAARHNYVVNKHRNNALGSFQAFASSAADEQTKSAVLIQATQSIFTPQVSGYVKSDGDNSPASPIIEILRSTGIAKEK